MDRLRSDELAAKDAEIKSLKEEIDRLNWIISVIDGPDAEAKSDRRRSSTRAAAVCVVYCSVFSSVFYLTKIPMLAATLATSCAIFPVFKWKMI